MTTRRFTIRKDEVHLIADLASQLHVDLARKAKRGEPVDRVERDDLAELMSDADYWKAYFDFDPTKSGIVYHASTFTPVQKQVIGKVKRGLGRS